MVVGCTAGVREHVAVFLGILPHHSRHDWIQSISHSFTLCPSTNTVHNSIVFDIEVCPVFCPRPLGLKTFHSHSDRTGKRFWYTAGSILTTIIGFLLAALTMDNGLRYMSL